MNDGAHETDVIVVGSGLSGLVASVRALEGGADVVLLEKSPELGGTTSVTGGFISVNQGGEPHVDAYEPIEESLAWLEEIGADFRETDYTDREGQDEYHVRIDPPEFVRHMAGYLEALGGEIRRATPFVRLLVDEVGAIEGVIAHDPEDGVVSIHADCVILATGGFSSNEELVEQHIGDASAIWLGRDPYSTGDGFLAAKEVGAKTTTQLSNPHGLSRPAPPAEIAFEEMRCGQVYETSALAIDETGTRFTDESKERVGHYAFIDDLLAAGGSCWLLFDQDLYENTERYQSSVASRVDLARDLGGTVLEAETMAELGPQLDAEGVNGERAIATLQAFNEAVREDGDRTLDPPRSKFREPMDRAPFYAVHVMAAILYFVGGLDVNHRGEVLSRALSTSSMRQHPRRASDVAMVPIPGLYAAGIEVGRHEEHGYYIGGLSLALGTGRIAGEHAAAHAVGR